MPFITERLHDNIAIETATTQQPSATAATYLQSSSSSSFSTSSSYAPSSLNHVTDTHHSTNPLVNVNQPFRSSFHPPTPTTFNTLLWSLLEACHLCQSVYTTLLPKTRHHNHRELKLMSIHKRKQVGLTPCTCALPPNTLSSI